MSYSKQIVAVRDSFDDEDASDDVEDEVFIRDGRNGSKVDEERGVKRPLMAPRRKQKSNQVHAEVCKGQPYRILCAPFCYGFIALSTLIGLIVLVVLLILWLPSSLNKLTFWKIGRSSASSEIDLIPCTEFSVMDVWTKSLPKLTIESSIRLNDINHDGVADVIIGFGTGIDDQQVSSVVCTIYFGHGPPCLGGVLALDGRNGNTIWQHWTPHTIYWLDCSGDLTGDSVNDCLASGKGGVLQLVNGHDGSLLWRLSSSDVQAPEKLFDVYSGQMIRDIDGDGIQDILAAHTEDSIAGEGLTGELVLVSGSTGRVLRRVATPGSEPVLYPPQLLLRADSQDIVLFGTGAQDTAGGLYAIPLSQLVLGDLSQLQTIYHDPHQSVMASPVLADINSDSYEDIVVATFNSAVLAFDGLTFERLWNFSTPGAETFSSPIPTYFNSDDIPDFLVKYQTGPGFPLYYYSQTAVLDGRTGTLIQKALTDSVASQSAGLSVSFEGFGNDVLLYWSAYCDGKEEATDAFSFDAGSSLQSRMRMDICKLRFNATQSYKVWALNQHIPPPGYAVYSSDTRQGLEFNNSRSTFLEAEQYMKSHPDFRDIYQHQRVRQRLAQPAITSQQPILVSDFGRDTGDNEREIFRHRDDHNHYNQGRGNYPGERERIMPGYRGEGYPNVRKHGDSNHPHNKQQWNRWPANEDPSVYQDDKYYGNQGGHRGWDYDSQYDPRLMDGYAQQRDERSKSRGGSRGSYSPEYPRPEEEIYQAKPTEPKNEPRRRKREPLKEGSDVRDTRKERHRRDGKEQRIEGIQRLSSTGVLAPPLAGGTDSIDVIFTTHWLPPLAEATGTNTYAECVQSKMAAAQLDSEKYFGMDAAAIKSAASAQCVNQSSPAFDPHSVSLGQATVYRLRIACRCSNLARNERCTSVVPFAQQSWPAFMGWNAKGYFRPRHK